MNGGPSKGTCAHGVRWENSCPICGRVVTTTEPVVTVIPAPAWTPEKVDRLLYLLAEIANNGREPR